MLAHPVQWGGIGDVFCRSPVINDEEGFLSSGLSLLQYRPQVHVVVESEVVEGVGVKVEVFETRSGDPRTRFRQ